MSKFVLFLIVEGKEIKRVVEIDEFKKPITVTLVQSINDVQDQLCSYKIEPNSYRANEVKCPVDDFEASVQGNIESNREYIEEQKKQAEIAKSVAAKQAEEDEKGRQRAAKLHAEEQERLREMKKAEEEKRLRRQTTVSVKKSTK